MIKWLINEGDFCLINIMLNIVCIPFCSPPTLDMQLSHLDNYFMFNLYKFHIWIGLGFLAKAKTPPHESTRSFPNLGGLVQLGPRTVTSPTTFTQPSFGQIDLIKGYYVLFFFPLYLFINSYDINKLDTLCSINCKQLLSQIFLKYRIYKIP